VSDRPAALKVVQAPAARQDIRELLKWSQLRFGERAAARYRALLKQALRDIAADPERPGSHARPDLAPGVRTYHLSYSRNRAKAGLGTVNAPRHFLIYRRHSETVVDLLRVLHDARDLERHLPPID
jgi:toxin ParE1/3/4